MASNSNENSDAEERNFVRWSEPVGGVVREESVVILSENPSETTIRAVTGLREKTPVYIRGHTNSGNGIVESCIREGDDYRVVIQLSSEEMLTTNYPQIDPGVFALDNFLTEEEESKILDSLGDSLDSAAAEDFEEAASHTTISIANMIEAAFPPKAVDSPLSPSVNLEGLNLLAVQ